ncbi:MAG: DUF3795 domain-containing protein [Methanomassiliicoccaceae archaeon]|nr:DUF3795 domain-containing protein [Methanomassiliicoccaceae archaeon]
MDEKYTCYCGLYCENCAVKTKIDPTAKNLYEEMKSAGFEEVIHFIPGGDGFWPFLKNMAENGTCTSCREGGGHPGCGIRTCAKNRGVEMCALCESYPCGRFDKFLLAYPLLKQDNALLREKGMEAWSQIQDERRARGFVHQNNKE